MPHTSPPTLSQSEKSFFQLQRLSYFDPGSQSGLMGTFMEIENKIEGKYILFVRPTHILVTLTHILVAAA